MPRLCPRCQVALTEKADRGVTLDACDKCHGLWFDANEIDQITKKVGMTDWLRGAGRACPQPVCPWCQHPQSRHGAACEKCGGAIGAICPVCLVWMQTFDVKGVTVDFCVRCAGLWLDANELEQLSANPPEMAAGPHAAAPGAAAGAPPAGYRPRPRYHTAEAPAGGPPPTLSVPAPEQTPGARPAPPPQGYQPPPQGYQPLPQGYQPPPQGYQPPPQGYQPPPQGYQPPPQGYQPPPQGYQQPQYAPPPPGYVPQAGYQPAPMYYQTPVQLVQPTPYVAAPVMASGVYYDPYWSTGYGGYYPYGGGYWSNGYWYDPCYDMAAGMAVGAAVGVGVGIADGFCSMVDFGCGFGW